MRLWAWTAVFAAVLWLTSPAASAQQRAGDCGFYVYGKGPSEGRHCAGTSQAPPPQRVAAICRDRSYSYEQGSGACWDHGGVMIWRH